MESMSELRHIVHHVDNKSFAGIGERTSPVFDPATGASRPPGPGQRRRRRRGRGLAVSAAAAWRDSSLSTRQRVLFAARELLAQRAPQIAAAITAEHGKVLGDAAGEVQRGIEVVEFACGIPQLLKGGFSEGVSTGVDVYSIRQPLGVVAVISPFNFPSMVPLWFVPIAIAWGNAVVLKPSEKDPTAANLIAEASATPGCRRAC